MHERIQAIRSGEQGQHEWVAAANGATRSPFWRGFGGPPSSGWLTVSSSGHRLLSPARGVRGKLSNRFGEVPHVLSCAEDRWFGDIPFLGCHGRVVDLDLGGRTPAQSGGREGAADHQGGGGAGLDGRQPGPGNRHLHAGGWQGSRRRRRGGADAQRQARLSHPRVRRLLGARRGLGRRPLQPGGPVARIACRCPASWRGFRQPPGRRRGEGPP